MDINQLRTFYTVAKHGSFSKSIKDLGLSQPAISRQVMLLEESLGTKLFNRHARRGLVLTSEGEMLLQKIKPILQNIENLRSALKQQGEPHGSFRLATSPFHVDTWLVPYIKQFLKKYPQVSLQISSHDDSTDLTLRQADLLIGTPALHVQNQSHVHLFDIPFRLYGSHHYIRHHGLPESIRSLEQHRLIYDPSLSFDDAHKKVNIFNHTPTLPSLKLNSQHAIGETTLSGLGIGLLPEVFGAAHSTELVCALKNEAPFVLKVYASFLEAAQHHINLKSFLKMMEAKPPQVSVGPEDFLSSQRRVPSG